MGNEYIIFITLGHNSSAIGMYNGQIIAGYEQERLDRKKSSSAFPKDAIERIFSIRKPEPDDVKKLYVSHWFDNFDFYKTYNEKIAKYWDYEYVKLNLNNFTIFSLHDNLTHHDVHCGSAINFIENDINADNIIYDSHIIVADGFGNNEEVLSIYRYNNNNGVDLINRVYGYENSLGLLYQYATSYCGMKENEDEYKFLGYESKINDLENVDYYYVIHQAELYAKSLFRKLNSTIKPEKTEFINLEKLANVKNNLHKMFDMIFYNAVDKSMFDEYSPTNNEEIFYKRVIIGTFIQHVIERYYEHLIDYYNIENVVLTGGLHYNVKLNNFVLNNISGYLSVPPLAGDQGAAIGGYKGFPYKDLKWGVRNLTENNIKLDNNLRNDVEYFYHIGKLQGENIYIFHENQYNEFVGFCIDRLMNNDIVQVVTGPMEFGPRALCNTSTLALPYRENVDDINFINKRNTVMPMAPVVTEEGYKYLFDDEQRNRLIGSHKYMICTLDYKDEITNSAIERNIYSGVMHPYPNFNNKETQKYSGRPQVVYDGYIYDVLKNIEKSRVVRALINTSYNCHGSPINYTLKDCINDFNYQKGMCIQKGSPKLMQKLYLVFYLEG